MFYIKYTILVFLFCLLGYGVSSNNNVPANSEQFLQSYTREKFFKKALSQENSNPLNSLSLLSKSICKQPISLNDNTADAKINQKIVKAMYGLIQRLSKNGYDYELIPILTPEVMVNAGSIEILTETVKIISKNQDYGHAVQFMEKVLKNSNYLGSLPKDKVNSITSHLYQLYITQQINYNKIYFAETIFHYAKSKFPNDCTINLDGVEIAVKQGKWKMAEQILNLMSYPESYSYRVELLRNQIAELRALVGKIVIKFIPGSNHIPTQAIINGTVTQNFVVDTGATSVTIPKSTVEALGISIPGNAPIRKVSTAGAIITAEEITLNSITLKKNRVNNIKALVLDIPGQPNLGLLGFNFLQHFQVQINNQKGMMLLTPK
jgi:clan AA aspartic protease (TIGR02281 family)